MCAFKNKLKIDECKNKNFQINGNKNDIDGSKNETVDGIVNERKKYFENLSSTKNSEMYDDDKAIKTLARTSREIEHGKSPRYQSFLQAALSPQVFVNTYKSNNNIKYEKSTSNIEYSDRIDKKLQNSFNKPYAISNGSSSKLLQDNKSLKWSDNKLVQSINILNKLSREEILFQETQFELISTEASFYINLNILVDKFYNSPLLSLQNSASSSESLVIKPHQKEHLFSNILQIHNISGEFLAALEKRFSQSVLIKDICDIVYNFAENHFNAYIAYIQNQRFQNETYMELKRNEKSKKIIKVLEKQPECCSLSLDSFLILPMQRLLRILLILKAIKKHVPRSSLLSLKSVEAAICSLEKVVSQCNINKGFMDERKRMLQISHLLKFKARDTFFSISSGTLLYEGELKCYRKNIHTKAYLSSLRNPKFDSWLILTDQCLLITKLPKYKDLSYLVEDWCLLNDIVVEESPLREFEFNVIFRNGNTYIFYTKTKEDYSKWISELSIYQNK